MLSVFLDVLKEPLPVGVPLRFRLRLNTSFSKISSTQKLCYPQCKCLQGEAVKGTALGIFLNPIFSNAPKSSSGSLMVFKTCIALLKCTSMLFLKMKPKETVEEKKINHLAPISYIRMLGTHCALVSKGRLHFIHAFFVRAEIQFLCAQKLRD